MDNNKQKNKNRMFSDRRFKYGSLAVGLTAAFIALVVAFNAVIYALAYSYGWYIDLTGSSVYSVSDEFYDHVDELMDVNSDNDPENDLYLNIVLLMEKDAFTSGELRTCFSIGNRDKSGLYAR